MKRMRVKENRIFGWQSFDSLKKIDQIKFRCRDVRNGKYYGDSLLNPFS